MSDYSDIADSLFGGQQQPRAPQPSVAAPAAYNVVPMRQQQPQPKGYDALADELFDDQRTERRMVLESAARTNPDEAAEAAKLSSKTGLPADVVARNLMDVRVQQAVMEADRKLPMAPDLERRMRESPLFAKQAIDDLDALTAAHGELKAWKGPRATIGNIARDLAGTIPGAMNTSRQTARLIMGDMLDAFGILPRTEQEKQEDIRRAVQAAAQAERNTPEFGNEAAQGLYSGVTSTLQQLPGLALSIAAANPFPALAFAGGSSFLSAYPRYRGRGATAAEASLGGALEGAVEIATEYTPMSFFVSKLSKTGISEFVTGFLAREMPREQVATILQDAVDTAIANPDKTWSEYLAERPAAAYQTFFATLSQSLLMGGGAHVVNRIARGAEAIQQAQDDGAKLQQLFEVATDSKLRQRNPQEFAKALQEFAESSPDAPETVFIDARALDEAFAQAGMNDAQVAELLPSVAPQIAQALAADTVVSIPLGELVANVTGTPLADTLLQQVRITPDALTPLEAQEAQEQAQEYLLREAESVIAQAQDNAAIRDEQVQVQQEVMAQLQSAGRFRPEVMQSYAMLTSAFYTTMAGRMGMTPLQLWQQRQLRVDATDPTEDEQVALDQPQGAVNGPDGNPAATQAAAATQGNGLQQPGGMGGSDGLLASARWPHQGNGSAGATLEGLPAVVKVNGENVRFSGYKPAQDAAASYAAGIGLPYNPPRTYAKVDPDRARRIAAEFDAMRHDPHNPEVKAAYDALVQETIGQYKAALAAGLKVEFIDYAKTGDPYGNPRNAILDVVENNHMWVFSTRDGFGTDANFDPSDNPLLAETEFEISGQKALVNDLFRVVHDYFGHVKEGVGFRADGEENAWRAHSAMFSPLARRALTTETRGQNSWVNYGPNGDSNRTASPEDTHFADQKIGLLPQWVSEEGVGDDGVLEQSMSTRIPSAKSATEDALTDILSVDWETTIADTKTLAKNVEALKALPNFKATNETDPVKAVEGFIEHAKANLLFLHDNMKRDWRKRARLWYDGGRLTVEAWAKRYGISEMQAAGVIAVLSPQNGWFENVSQAERILDMVYGLRDFKWDLKMTAEALRISPDGTIDEKMREAEGKTLGELLDRPEIAARWIRVYDQTHNSRAFRVLTPEGGAAGYSKTGTGSNAIMRWKSYVTIAKAVSILMDGRAENVHYQIGKEHKVRNFYNNLFDPKSPYDFTTIDTHAVAAALMRPLAATDTEVLQAFGSTGSASSNKTGLNGTYPIYLEAYRRAAQERGILPREMQSITWEAVRGLYEAAQKRTLKGKVNAVWERYKAGELTQEEAQRQAFELGGGITAPDWAEVPFTDKPGRTYSGPGQEAIDARGDVGTAATPASRIMFEVAPDPNDAALTAQWNALSQADKLRFSQDVAAQIVPEVLRELGTSGDFDMQYGGYLGATNPSLALRLDRPELALEAAKLLGYALSQDSMVVVGDVPFVGGSEVGSVTITLPPGYGEKDITQLYDKLWELEENGEKLVGGHTTADGQMVLLNFTGLSTDELGRRVDEHLGGQFEVFTDTVYAAFPQKGSYGFEAQEAGGTAGQSPAQRRPRDFRAQASAILASRLASAGAFQQLVRPDAGSGVPGGSLGGQEVRGQVGKTYGVAREGAHPPITAYHFSHQPRTTLTSGAYGTGLQGAEMARLEGADPRLKQRIYFYIDRGTGINPEAGVGGYAHSVTLNNVYDADADPLRLLRDAGGFTNFELAIINAGFDGYLTREAGPSGNAVLLGAHAVGVDQMGPQTRFSGEVVPRPQERVLSMGEQIIANKELPQGQVKGSRWLEILSKRMPDVVEHYGADNPAFTSSDFMYRDGLVKKLEAGLGELQQRARGTYSPKQTLVTLTTDADLSTFIHESGHFFLDMMTDLASATAAPAAVVEDVNTILRWFGFKDDEQAGTMLQQWRSMSLDGQRQFHERWAESFEQYALEGKAPSTELRPVFGRFRAWMLSIYKGLRQFVAGRSYLRLSDEVRAVMDRMLASDEQIKQAESLARYEAIFRSADEAGMSPEEWAKYQADHQQATEEAISTLTSRTLKDLQWVQNARSKELKRLQKDADDKRKAMRKEVTEQLRMKPVYAVQRFLKTGNVPENYFDGANRDQRRALTDVGLGKVKLSTKALQDMYGDSPAAPWRYLSTSILSNSEDAVHPNVIAELFGFDDGDAMVRAILEALPEDQAIEQATDQGMLEAYGDITSPKAMEAAANEAIHNEARARFLASEIAALKKGMGGTVKVGKANVNVMVQAAKDFAQKMTARRRILDLKPQAHTAAEARAGMRAQEAMAKGKTDEVLAAKRDQLLNHYAAKYAARAQEDIEKRLAYLRKFDKDSVRKNLPPEYLEQIDAILERFDLRKGTSARDIQRSQSLMAWVAQQQAMGLDPNIPQEVLDEAQRRSYKEMAVEEFTGMVDGIKNIEHLGRLKSKLLKAKDQREFQAIVDEIAAHIKDRAKTVREPDLNARTSKLDRIADAGRQFLAEHRKISSIVRQLDGFEDAGPMWRAFVRSMNESADAESTMRAEATAKLAEMFKPFTNRKHLVGKSWSMQEKKMGLTLETRLSIALNWGNDANRQRIMDGDRLSPAQVQAILGTLTREQLQFVQDTWDFIDSYWEQIKAKEERVSGVAPEKVEAAPFNVRLSDGTEVAMKGGYYPIKYDPDKSRRAQADSAAEVTENMLKGHYTRASTSRGHTKARVEHVERPVRHDLGVVFQHVNQVIHDLAWHEWLIDANRLLSAPEIDEAIRSTMGPVYVRELNESLTDIAMGDIPAQSGFERSMGHLRHGVSAVGMGFNLMTSLMQPLGLLQSMARIGPKWVGKGLSKWVGDAARMENTVARINEKSDFMKHRAQTMNREIAEVRNRIEKGRMAAVYDSYYWLIQKAQMIADVPTWLGAYEKAMAEFDGDEKLAIDLADQAVRDSQGSGETAAMARIQRKDAVWKLFTTFYSFFNTTYNIAAEKINGTHFDRPREVGRLAVDMLLLFVLPSVLATLMRQAIVGGDDDDDEELTKKLVQDQLSYLMGTMVGLREASTLVSDFDYTGPAGVRFFSELHKLGKQAAQGEVDGPLLKAVNNVAGILFHYPAGQINRMVEGYNAWSEGEAGPQAIIVGPPR